MLLPLLTVPPSRRESSSCLNVRLEQVGEELLLAPHLLALIGGERGKLDLACLLKPEGDQACVPLKCRCPIFAARSACP
jgi:hypothetical protein